MRIVSSRGLDGLAAALAQALGVRGLRIVAWDHCSNTEGPRRLVVENDAEPVAVVLHDSDDLDDPLTAEAVARAVRLSVVNQRLLDQQRTQLGELEAARSRLLAAADLARWRVGAELRRDVAPAMAAAAREIERARIAAAPVPPIELAEATNELAALRIEVTDMLRGIAPRELGGGSIRDALAALPQGLPLPVDLNIDSAVCASADVETTVFYVCAEALTNSVKHAQASRIAVTLDASDDVIKVRVADDGDGGADVGGFGLRGLCDRVAVSGGRLLVDSPPGGGTVISVELPMVN
jgi:glucose-6-phosphate-specific signal transduction histidine kinase